jgi:hypothetical protein
MVLCEYQQKAEFDKLKIQAAFFGVNLDEKGETKVKKKKDKEDDFMFKDPKEYEKMEPEERKRLTDKMVGQHQKWASGKLKKG